MYSSFHRICVGWLIVAFAVCTPANGQNVDPVTGLRARLQAKLDSLHAAGRFPGATLGVALPGGVSFGIATGFSDTTLHERMTRDHRLLQGSVGKTYFAAVALQLVREGKLNLETRIETYLGQETWWKGADGKHRLPNGADITVRQLMNHTSGVMRYEFTDAFQRDLSEEPLRTWTPVERLQYILDVRAAFAAGAGWEYSDTNYILLGMILEMITGRSVYDEVRTRILEPHQLSQTIPSDRLVLPGVAQGYAGPDNPFGGADAMIRAGRFVLNPQLEWTGGGFASTAEDLARWGRLLYEGQVFGAELLRQATSGVPARGLGQGAQYGIATIIRETPLGTSYGHSGFFPGYIAEMRHYPGHRFAAALQFNTSVGQAIGRNPGAILQDLAAVIALALAQNPM